MTALSLALSALGLLAWDAWRRKLAHDDRSAATQKLYDDFAERVSACENRLGKVEHHTVERRVRQ